MFLSRITVVGHSMEPTILENQKVLATSVPYFFIEPKVGDIVVCKANNSKKLYIKRIKKMQGRNFFVEGDNKKDSFDSRKFGSIKRKEILGKVIWTYS